MYSMQCITYSTQLVLNFEITEMQMPVYNKVDARTHAHKPMYTNITVNNTLTLSTMPRLDCFFIYSHNMHNYEVLTHMMILTTRYK